MSFDLFTHAACLAQRENAVAYINMRAHDAVQCYRELRRLGLQPSVTSLAQHLARFW